MSVTNLKAFQDLVADYAAPYAYTPKVSTAQGPNSYSTSQATPYFIEWTFSLEGTTLTFQRTDELTAAETSVLYDSIFEAEHITGTFDAASREVIAWDYGRQVITGKSLFRIGHFVGGVATWATIEGRNPVVVNTWPFDSEAATAGDAEVGVFYLRKGFPYIFFRTKGDDFATEFVALRSPSAPLALHSLAFAGSNLELRGVDVGHRKTAWRALYVPPIPPEQIPVIASLTAGMLVEVAVAADAGEDRLTAAAVFTLGEFISSTIEAPPAEDRLAAAASIGEGVFFQALITTDAGNDTIASDAELTNGILFLTTKTTEVLDDTIAAAASLTTGSFQTP